MKLTRLHLLARAILTVVVAAVLVHCGDSDKKGTSDPDAAAGRTSGAGQVGAAGDEHAGRDGGGRAGLPEGGRAGAEDHGSGGRGYAGSPPAEAGGSDDEPDESGSGGEVLASGGEAATGQGGGGEGGEPDEVAGSAGAGGGSEAQASGGSAGVGGGSGGSGGTGESGGTTQTGGTGESGGTTQTGGTGESGGTTQTGGTGESGGASGSGGSELTDPSRDLLAEKSNACLACGLAQCNPRMTGIVNEVPTGSAYLGLEEYPEGVGDYSCATATMLDGSSGSELCLTLLECVLETECIEPGDAPGEGSGNRCYCGNSGADYCLVAGYANGPCKAEVEVALETARPAQIAMNYGDVLRAGGRANLLVQCLTEWCTPECFPNAEEPTP